MDLSAFPLESLTCLPWPMRSTGEPITELVTGIPDQSTWWVERGPRDVVELPSEVVNEMTMANGLGLIFIVHPDQLAADRLEQVRGEINAAAERVKANMGVPIRPDEAIGTLDTEEISWR